MSLTLETMTIALAPEDAAWLRGLAEAKGTDESGAVRELVEDARLKTKTLEERAALEDAKPKTGADLLRELEALDAFNPEYGDPNMDGQQMARAIREGRWPPRDPAWDEDDCEPAGEGRAA